MYRCFANNNIIPIKSSKEHMEDKRNNELRCFYPNCWIRYKIKCFIAKHK